MFIKLEIKFALAIFTFFTIQSCKQNKNETLNILQLKTYAIQQGTIYLEALDNKTGEFVMMDSFIANSGMINKQLIINDSAKQVYRIRVKPTNVNFVFVFDNNEIKIEFDFIKNNKILFTNSPINTAFQNLKQLQQSFSRKINEIDKSNIGIQNPSSKGVINKLHQQSIENYIAFADTIKHPAAFLIVYDLIDFGSDIKRQTQFLEKNSLRFNKHLGVNRILSQFKVYKHIIETEINIGDSIPNVELLNFYNKKYTTASLKGKPYIINFWSSWCNSCIPYLNELNTLIKQCDTSKIAFLNIAVDMENEDCLKILTSFSNNNLMINLIDTKMWNGETVNKYSIDSIPYNFIISEKGTVLEKALKPEQIKGVLQKYFPSVIRKIK